MIARIFVKDALLRHALVRLERARGVAWVPATVMRFESVGRGEVAIAMADRSDKGGLDKTLRWDLDR